MLTDKELDEIEARLAGLTAYSATISGSPTWLKLLADAVTLLAEVRRLHAETPDAKFKREMAVVAP